MSFIKKLFQALSVNKEDAPVGTTQEHDYATVNKKDSENSLSPEEILMVSYADGLDVDYKNYPGYWEYQYNSNPHHLVEGLLSKELLEVDDSLKSRLNNVLVKELKLVLKEKELKVSGNKKELIERLIAGVSEVELVNTFVNQKYRMTDIGKKLVEQHDYIKFFHSYPNLGISIYRAYAIKRECPEMDKFEIAHVHLESLSSKYISDSDWGLYRNARLSLSELHSLHKDYLNALRLLLDVCYYDLSGTSNNFDVNRIKLFEDDFSPYTDSFHMIPPGIISRLQEFKDRLLLTDNQFSELYYLHTSSIVSPIHLFTREETLNIILNELNSDKENVRAIYSVAEKRYQKEGINGLLTIQGK